MWPQGHGGFNFNTNTGPNGPYGSPLLNEIHTHFPALLYDGRQFNTTRDVFHYVNRQMQQRYDIFSMNQQLYMASQNLAVHAPRVTPIPPRANVGPRGAGYTGNQWNAGYMAGIASMGLSGATGPAMGLSGASGPVGPAGPSGAAGPAGPAGPRQAVEPLLNQIVQALFLEPVTVAATQAHIDLGTDQYSAIGENDPCAICQDTIAEGNDVRRLRACSHVFHTACIDTWLGRHVRCPVCRHDIRDD